jgi:Asp-tRNA(Asn)/Glu-tRNA(Gln) amidotransferase A subunit family amidase
MHHEVVVAVPEATPGEENISSMDNSVHTCKFAGCPFFKLPAEVNDNNGLCMGMQLFGRRDDGMRMLGLAASYHEVTSDEKSKVILQKSNC